jgi:hypothetical protein
MKLNWRAMTGIVALAIVALLPSCSNSDISSGTEGLTVKFVPSPSGAGRFERATYGIAAIRILPNDPATLAIYGTKQLNLRFDPYEADLTSTEPSTFSRIALATGSYRVTRIVFNNPSLVDTNVSSTPATCIEGVAAVPSGPAGGQVPPQVEFVNPAGLEFTVSPGQSVVSLTVDVPRLISEFQAEFTCVSDCGGGQPCLVGFDVDAYRATLLNTISIP